MALSLTQYATILPSYLKGIIEAYSTISDPLVISGFMKSQNIEWVPYELDGGISCNRLPIFTGETVTDGTRFNRAGFDRIALSQVTTSDRKFRSSAPGQTTRGALDDPRRLARILNLASPDLSDMTYVVNVIRGHSTAAYWDYLENFVSLLYKDCNIKNDYDNTTGSAGNVVTFENDVKYPAHKLVTNVVDKVSSISDRGSDLMIELRGIIDPMIKYIQGQPIFFLLNYSTFWAFMNVLEPYKYYHTHGRYNENSVGGTFQYQNSSVFSFGDFIFVGLPNLRFPTTVVDTEDAFRCLVCTPDAMRMQVSMGDLSNSVSIYDQTIKSVGVGDAYNYAQSAFSEASFSKIQSYMGIEPNISAFMENGSIGGNTIPNLLKIYTSVLPSGTDQNAEYTYTRAQYNIAVIRANPYALREIQVKPSLIGYTVGP